MSLADAIAAASCATNLVLLGDPQQLDQPLQGTHPPGAECSALAHLLNGEQVMPDHLGLFLDGTWRLHPSICAYTSEGPGNRDLVGPANVLNRTAIAAASSGDLLEWPSCGTGRNLMPAPSNGGSPATAQAVRQLLAQTATWTDARHGRQVPGPRGTDLDLLDGNKLSCRRTTRDGVPIQSQPPERRNEPSPMRSCCRREPAHSACALPDAPADAARERARSARGDRLDVTLSHRELGR